MARVRRVAESVFRVAGQHQQCRIVTDTGEQCVSRTATPLMLRRLEPGLFSKTGWRCSSRSGEPVAGESRVARARRPSRAGERLGAHAPTTAAVLAAGRTRQAPSHWGWSEFLLACPALPSGPSCSAPGVQITIRGYPCWRDLLHQQICSEKPALVVQPAPLPADAERFQDANISPGFWRNYRRHPSRGSQRSAATKQSRRHPGSDPV